MSRLALYESTATTDPAAGYRALLAWFPPRRRIVVAFSGGVDSALVLRAARDAVSAERVTAITADSPSLARSELAASQALALSLGVRQIVMPTDELDDERYRANRGDRCYFCKSALYRSLDQLWRTAASTPGGTESEPAIVVDGTNLDDLSDIRPGRRAAQEAGVRHPLAEAGLRKEDVRELCRHLEMDVWQKPAMACLASRIPTGVEVTRVKMERIEAAEEALRSLGFREVRLRYHELAGHSAAAAPLLLARIELGAGEVERFLDETLRAQAADAVRRAGFAFVTLDLEGYRPGGRVREAP